MLHAKKVDIFIKQQNMLTNLSKIFLLLFRVYIFKLILFCFVQNYFHSINYSFSFDKFL